MLLVFMSQWKIPCLLCSCNPWNAGVTWELLISETCRSSAPKVGNEVLCEFPDNLLLNEYAFLFFLPRHFPENFLPSIHCFAHRCYLCLVWVFNSYEFRKWICIFMLIIFFSISNEHKRWIYDWSFFSVKYFPLSNAY